MQPRLFAISGVLKDQLFPIVGDELSIGRDTSNALSIGDRLLSRRHCVIRREADGFKVYDLESSNSTYVNRVPVKEKLLAHGDLLSIGRSQFLFLTEEGVADAHAPAETFVSLRDANLLAGETLRLRVEEAVYLQPERLLDALPTLAAVARDYSVLLKISSTVNHIRQPAELERQLLESIFAFVPAECGAILLADDTGEVVPTTAVDRKSGAAGEVRVSRTIVRQVLAEGVALLSNDVLETPALAAAGSLISSRTTSLACVPLKLFGRTLGVIYLSTTDERARFDESHLQLLSVVAGIAAVALENARHMERLEGENRQLRDSSIVKHEMVGEAAVMREVYQFIARVAHTSSTVLITGESGTGKELAARAIHASSPRAERPFVAINCAAITETLLESELFGHERGAFTGALAQKKGKFEVADRGTLFLDEIGELTPPLQAKLLRVLQEREFERVGGTRTIKVDVRVVAATNRDLEEAIRAREFRSDLFYRLNVISFEMPPLRRRREDIPLLAGYFVTKYAGEFKRKIFGLSPEARACLVAYDWPGNVRELQNAIERAVVLGTSEQIRPEDLPEMIVESARADASPPLTEYHAAIKEAKRQLILKAFEQAGGSYTEAARSLGVHPNYLHRLIRNLDLKPLLKK